MSKKYIEAEKKENKRLLGGLLFLLAVGVIFNAVAWGVFFGYCKPFDNRWVKYECVVLNKEWYEIDVNTVKVVYFVDGIQYENTLRVNSDEGGRTKVIFLYNKENPDEIITTVREPLMVIMPIVAAVGTGLAIIGIVTFAKAKRRAEKA